MKPKLLIFASGTASGGGSGFENLVHASRSSVLHADIVGVVSNRLYGGVCTRAERLGIQFAYLPAEFSSAAGYRTVIELFKPDFIALSGWMLKTEGLDPRTTFNIHPAPLPRFGGKGMYGDRLHQAVLDAYGRGEIEHTAVTMHFVTDEYDTGPIFFEQSVPIEENDTVETLRKRVQQAEHECLPRITQSVISGSISWDGKDPASLVA